MAMWAALVWATASAMVRIDVDVDGPTTALEPFWKRSFGSGHAALGLRDDWQAALARGAEAYGLAGIRQHGMRAIRVQCFFARFSLDVSHFLASTTTWASSSPSTRPATRCSISPI